MSKTTDFQNKWALITGASSGIGAAFARELAAHGAKLILTARRRDRLDALAAELAAQGAETRIVVADLNDPTAPDQIFAATEGASLVVDILVNNAGLGQFGAFVTNNRRSGIQHGPRQLRSRCSPFASLPAAHGRAPSRLDARRRVSSQLSAGHLSLHLRGHQGFRPLLRARCRS